MKAFHAALLVMACTSAPEAGAQTPSTFETQATSLASDCLAAPTTAPETASAAIGVCEKLLVDLDALKQATPSLEGNDLNVFLVVKAMGESRVAASYGRIDGRRTARVCDRAERSWTATSQVNKTHSPAYVAMIDQMTASAVSAISKCRQEFGVPAGAAPLP